MTTTKKFILNRLFSVRYNKEQEKLFIGYNPPHAFEIKDKNFLLYEMVKCFKKPSTLGRATYRLTKKYPISEVIQAIDLATNKNLIVPIKSKQISIYDRHDLYASLFSVNQTQEQLLQNKKIAIIGVGGIGSNCAILAASAGIKELHLIDSDKVEDTNLTRTTLFSHTDIGKRKVTAAKSRINKSRKDIKIYSHIKPFNTKNLTYYCNKLKNIDAFILSADKAEVHEAALLVSQKFEIPYINAGYAESKGVVGPFYIPGKTACSNCESINKLGSAITLSELNPLLQAASFGPLNYIVAGLAIAEILKQFWGVETQLAGNRWIFDSQDLNVVLEKIKINKECNYCNGTNKKRNK